ncbi:MAG TPA: SGNH/GDSL hydrolase family protein [Candidatus Acidoferrales bacterium]|nr:SGNH/GDSL hydrolase family protein [Candidatus Acidoferrales bacterium]
MLVTRRGIPRVAHKIVTGEAVRLVAFGTSMSTHSDFGVRKSGYYLDMIVPTLSRKYNNNRIELLYRGLEGFPSLWGVHRVRSDLLPTNPDLVLLEFAHNDVGYPPAAIEAMVAIVTLIHAALPVCEICIVLLAPPGSARDEPNGAMRAHESIAEYYGFPTFDLATLAERVVASGAATWTGDPNTALTYDGIHHSVRAITLIGAPFATAFDELVQASLQLPQLPNMPSPPTVLVRADRAALREFADAGWTIGPAPKEITRRRSAAAYIDEIAVARNVGASFQVSFVGKHVQVWTLPMGGAISVEFDGLKQSVDLPAEGEGIWRLITLASDMPDIRHTVRVSVDRLPVTFGDVHFVGELR